MQRPRKYCAKCGRAHNAECIQGTSVGFGCCKSGHMVKDFPQNRGQVEVMLSLGSTHKVEQKSSLLRGTSSML